MCIMGGCSRKSSNGILKPAPLPGSFIFSPTAVLEQERGILNALPLADQAAPSSQPGVQEPCEPVSEA